MTWALYCPDIQMLGNYDRTYQKKGLIERGPEGAAEGTFGPSDRVKAEGIQTAISKVLARE